MSDPYLVAEKERDDLRAVYGANIKNPCREECFQGRLFVSQTDRYQCRSLYSKRTIRVRCARVTDQFGAYVSEPRRGRVQTCFNLQVVVWPKMAEFLIFVLGGELQGQLPGASPDRPA